jgi:3-oxoacid CoA-transferase subunit A/glutaconate CoA-transferase subunit A
MEVLRQGKGELLGWRDPDENREWVRKNKSRELKDKRTTVADAVGRFVHDGDYVAVGGFGSVRVPMAVIYEIVRQKRRHLAMAGKTATHDIDILIGGGCVDRAEVAYAFGHELRGLSPAGRRAVETGRCRVVAETSNASFQWRFLAAAMGLPFMVSRTLMGTDTFEKSSARVVTDPWSGKPVCLIPACYPDVAMIHVYRADKYGNCQIDASIVEDFELVRAARRVIVTAEEIVDDAVIRAAPYRTEVPFFLVDAVCEVPFGAHPLGVPGLYYSDEDHIGEWMKLSRTDEGAQAYFDTYVHGTRDFNEYLTKVGGIRRMTELRNLEKLCAPMPDGEGK